MENETTAPTRQLVPETVFSTNAATRLRTGHRLLPETSVKRSIFSKRHANPGLRRKQAFRDGNFDFERNVYGKHLQTVNFQGRWWRHTGIQRLSPLRSVVVSTTSVDENRAPGCGSRRIGSVGAPPSQDHWQVLGCVSPRRPSSQVERPIGRVDSARSWLIPNSMALAKLKNRLVLRHPPAQSQSIPQRC